MLDEASLVIHKTAFENNTASISIPGKNLGLYYFVVENYNDGRPIPLLLSNENTTMHFEHFKTVKEGKFFNEIYPNIPVFTRDPNANELFYHFLQRLISFSDTIFKYSSDLNSDVLKETRRTAYNSFLAYSDSIVSRNSDKAISAVVLDYLMKNNLLTLPELQDLFDQLSVSARNNYSAFEVAKEIAAEGKLKPGCLAPTFDFVALNNARYNIKDFRNKKILLHFWSEACVPCLAEAPDLRRINEQFKDSLVIINVSLDVDSVKWQSGIAKAGVMKMINFMDNEHKVATLYNCNLMPAYYLINHDQTIICKGTVSQIEEKLKTL